MNGGHHPQGLSSHPLRWFPEFLEFGRRRFRSQGRVLAASILVGIIAGLGGVVFSVAGQFVVQVCLEGLAGYRVEGPGGEVHFPWLPQFDTEFRPWMLLLVPTVGGLVSGFLVFRLAPEAEGHGTGIIWRLYSITRYQERDGGVYVELEAIALSRDIPGGLRWIVEPIVRRVSRSSLVASFLLLGPR